MESLILPYAGSVGSLAVFILCFLVIISMLSQGYVRYTLCGRHPRLITAWSAAGVFGPVLVNYIREYQINHGVPKTQAYNATMYIMAGLLIIGLICNSMIKAVHERHYMKQEVLDEVGVA